MPFADRDEWLSWQTRPIPEFNFNRQNELDRLRTGGHYTFNPLSAWVPGPFKNALITAITGLLDPNGSPLGALTPSATWGMSPMDAFHCHVVIDIGFLSTPSWAPIRVADEAIHQRMLAMMRQADLAGPEGFPPWTASYRSQLLAPAAAGVMAFRDQCADVLNRLLANSIAEQQTLKLVWHTFERPIWRPVDVGSDNPRRSWWNDVAPTPSGVTQTPFSGSGSFGANVLQLTELGMLVDQDRVITVMMQTLNEAEAIVNLDKARVDALADGLPFP
jgi:hypothetical protein